MDTETLRTFLQQAGVHLWCSQDAVIYADKDYVFLHTAADAAYTLELPDKTAALYDSFSGTVFEQGTVLPRGKSLWLRYGKE